MVDAAGKIYVTDFGLARFGPDAGLTMSGDLLGTLRYMSPEQAMARHGLVDHRTDIYSLGATLYELLTGQPAVVGDDKQEVLKQIAFEEPIPLRKIDRAIPVELETIALKALAKEPGERYATAKELAEDLRRWLEDKAIKAKPPGGRERVVKWARRHVMAVWAIAGMASMAIAAFSVSTILILREKARTDDQFQVARQAVDDMYTEVAEEWLSDAPHLTDLQKRFLNKALRFYQTLGAERADDPAVAQEVARAYFRIGQVEDKLGRVAESEAAFRTSIERYQRLLSTGSGDLSIRVGLGQALSSLATHLEQNLRLTDAVQNLLRAIEIQEGIVAEFKTWPGYWPHLGNTLNRLGSTYQSMGQQADALRVYSRAREIRERLAAEFPDNASFQSDLGATLHNLVAVIDDSTTRVALLGRAIDCQIAALKAEPRRVQPQVFLAKHYQAQGSILRGLGKWNDAITANMESIKHINRLIDNFPSVPDYRHILMRTQVNLCGVFDDSKRPAEAVRTARAACELGRNLVAEFPNSRQYYRTLAHALSNLAISSKHAAVAKSPDPGVAENTESRAAYQEAIPIFERLIAWYPNDPSYRQDLAATLNDLARGMLVLGEDLAIAQSHVQRAIELQREALRMRPDDPTGQRYLGIQHSTMNSIEQIIANAHVAAKKPEDALATYRKTQQRLEKLVAEFPTEQGYRALLGNHWINVGNMCRKLGRTDDELMAWRRATELIPNFSSAHEFLGRALADSGQESDALTALRRAVALDANSASAHTSLGAFLTKRGQFEESLPILERAIQLDPNSSVAHCCHGIALRKLGRHHDALAPLRRAIELNPGLVNAHHALAVALADLGQVDEALSAIDKGLELTSNSPLLANTREKIAAKRSINSENQPKTDGQSPKPP
jgi:tetratricopeptide (TPR) repeat protein